MRHHGDTYTTHENNNGERSRVSSQSSPLHPLTKSYEPKERRSQEFKALIYVASSDRRVDSEQSQLVQC